MHAYLQTNTLCILVMLPTQGTKTAKVEGLWLVERPKCLCQNTQMTVTAAPRLGHALLL